MTLTEFLLTRIADDEEAARQALALRGSGTDWPLSHPCDPGRVLADCEAKRRIVEHCDATPACGGYIPPGRERDEYDARLGFIPTRHLPEEYAPGCDGCSAAESVSMSDSWILKHLAAVYADHPDYQEEWKP